MTMLPRLRKWLICKVGLLLTCMMVIFAGHSFIISLSGQQVQYGILYGILQSNISSTYVQSVDVKKETKESYNSVLLRKNGRANKTSVVMTLVLAYMRGGSTFTGDVLKQAEGTHYLYEPLHDLSIRVDDGRAVTFMNGSEVNLTNKETIARTKAEILKSWFLCQPENVDHGSLLVSHFLYHMRELSQHYSCQKRVNGDRIKIMEKCLTFLRQKCLAAKTRTIKEISITMDTVEYLLYLLPEVNIIHVVRDPRAIIDSQITSELIDKRKIPQEVEKLCQSMKLNTDILKKLLKIDRLKIITYEDFSLQPMETARDLYNFSGLQFTRRAENFLKRIAMTKGKVHPCRWCSSKGDSRMASVKWRTRITQNVLDIVQSTCGDVMESYGYKIIKDKAALSDMSVDTREIIPNVIKNDT